MKIEMIYKNDRRENELNSNGLVAKMKKRVIVQWSHAHTHTFHCLNSNLFSKSSLNSML